MLRPDTGSVSAILERHTRIMAKGKNLPIRRRSAVIERAGVNYVRAIVEGANCLFHEIAVENDYGNDAFIQIVDGEAVTGHYVLVQIKAGESYCEDDCCFIPATRTQLLYWSSHKLPVVGIVYDPTDAVGYWISITAYLRSRPEVFSQDTHRIRIDKEELSRFDEAGFRDFFLPWILGRPPRLDYQRSVRFTLEGAFDLHSIGIRSLFYQFRNRIQTWEVLERALLERKSVDLDPIIAYFLAHAPGHGDIAWHEQSVLDPDIRAAAVERMTQWDTDVIIKLVELIDDNGFGRGTIGQSVYAIVDQAVERADSKLANMLRDEEIDVDTRTKALYLYCLVAQENAGALLDELSTTHGPLGEAARMMQDHLRQGRFFYP